MCLAKVPAEAEGTRGEFLDRILFQIGIEPGDPDGHLEVCLVYLFPLH